VAQAMCEKTESERILEQYLEGQSLTWTRPSGSDRKQPDYEVQHRGASYVFEVKEFDYPAPEPSGGFSPCRPIQKKINRAREQFKEYPDQCCALVLWNSKSILRDVRLDVVLSAAFGERVDIEPKCAGDPRAEPLSYQFSGKAALTPTSNTTISAIAILVRYQLDQVWLEAWRRLSEKMGRGEVIQPFDESDITQQVSREFVGPRYLYQGTIRMIVLENPYAKIAFPLDLFTGPFDQRWRLESGRFSLCFLGSELTRLKQSGVPFVYL